MRIAQISTTGTFLPEYYISNEYLLCRGLAQRGHKVTLFTVNKTPKWQTIKSKKEERRIERYDGFSVHRLSGGPEIGIVPLIPGLFSTLMKMDFDVIHVHDFFAVSSFYGAIVSRVKGLPLILTQHNDTFPSKSINALLYLLNSYSLGRFVFSYSQKIIALDSAIKIHLVAMGVDENKIEIIPNGIDTRFFSPNQKNLLENKWGISRPTVLFVGRLVEDKGVRYLLKAFSEVVKKIPEAKLVIVGKGPQERELRKLQEKLDLTNVFFLGALKSRLMPEIYAGCDVLVLPSVHEPFGNVVIEAMASGKPVIGNYVGGIKDTIVHGVTGYHVPPRNSQKISEFIIKLLRDSSLKEKMGNNARVNAITNYNIDTIVKKIEDIYYDQCFN